MKSYFRFLSRHRLFTFINIVGLCLSMAFLLLLGDLIYRQTTVENYQTRADRTFVVGNEMCMMSNFRVGERLKERFPEVEDWCSMAGYGMTFNIGGQKADTKVLVTGQNFFTFFDYRLLTGDTFCGALCTALAQGKELSEAAHFACRAAAVTVSRMGAQQAMPYLRELDGQYSLASTADSPHTPA